MYVCTRKNNLKEYRKKVWNSYQVSTTKYPRKRYIARTTKYRHEVSIIVMEEIVIVMWDMRLTAEMTMVIPT